VLDGVGAALLGTGMLWFYFGVVQHSEFATLGSALALIYIVPAGVAAGLVLYVIRCVAFTIRGNRGGRRSSDDDSSNRPIDGVDE
jgi:uncharacterized membrane-anchored protein